MVCFSIIDGTMNSSLPENPEFFANVLFVVRNVCIFFFLQWISPESLVWTSEWLDQMSWSMNIPKSPSWKQWPQRCTKENIMDSQWPSRDISTLWRPAQGQRSAPYFTLEKQLPVCLKSVMINLDLSSNVRMPLCINVCKDSNCCIHCLPKKIFPYAERCSLFSTRKLTPWSDLNHPTSCECLVSVSWVRTVSRT